MTLTIENGWLDKAQKKPSPFYNQRPTNDVSLLVIHNISLPAGEFGHTYIDDLFLGNLDCDAHQTFKELEGLEVSAHFLIRRNGEITQFVNCDERAWHAGVSEFEGRSGCNDFSIGIELEGADTCNYEDTQYQSLLILTQAIIKAYPAITTERIIGHCHIAPVRKTDPGPYFDWQYYLSALS
ncbi:1,6-anhydro-N-acetylmuramyl-L-alanine amidase AmpD [Shewanella sp. 202IG2-18]|uniref:1,6-anhydro-N-acetylmuramyl-L-alanine amidase AmpD n=1 Tax=Parashewanella hymeniacidonis TaxID=2807618 RepID=UPI00195F7A77|nr:1,6-anhydro-N-acetylmuramyl-L-alanine amidase AmpD [Parashewanella hymeniacidonis]MBM7073368.1 1,6-anhydro-N-acetylmuramyl-L-alanine amidase AmpD [Parashewanella hymeniacidonis]